MAAMVCSDQEWRINWSWYYNTYNPFKNQLCTSYKYHPPRNCTESLSYRLSSGYTVLNLGGLMNLRLELSFAWAPSFLKQLKICCRRLWLIQKHWAVITRLNESRDLHFSRWSILAPDRCKSYRHRWERWIKISASSTCRTGTILASRYDIFGRVFSFQRSSGYWDSKYAHTSY